MTPLCTPPGFNAYVSAANTSRCVNARWAFADMIAFLKRNRAKSHSPVLRKRNIGPFGWGIAEQLGVQRGPSGGVLAVCVCLILLAVRGQIETKQSTVGGSHYIFPDVYSMDFQGKDTVFNIRLCRDNDSGSVRIMWLGITDTVKQIPVGVSL